MLAPARQDNRLRASMPQGSGAAEYSCHFTTTPREQQYESSLGRTTGDITAHLQSGR
jgi:hypothetical protein